MRFRTELMPARSPFTVDHIRRGFVAGSCFSENIAAKLCAARFPITANPTGVLFNPMSIADMLGRLSDNRPYGVDELNNADGLWFSYDHHGSFSSHSAEDTLAGINSSFVLGADALRVADYVILTFGTAWIYRCAATGEVVANCHKQPSSAFARERLTVSEIVDVYDRLLSGVLKDKQVLFTVSPVRHLKDGFAENSLSKAILRMAVEEINIRHGNTYYFPSFEIMTDDLRDYRFYAEDMVHPSQQAVDYIWEKFSAYAMQQSTAALLPKLERLTAAMNHRMMNTQRDTAVKFRESSLRLLSELQKELPVVDFSQEVEYFDRMG